MEKSDWTVDVSRQAQRDLTRLQPEDRVAILDAIDRMRDFPTRGDLAKLRGRPGEWRLRVGAFRVVFRPDWKLRELVVSAIGPRKDVYRG